jgi:hypothetical protein
MSQAQSAKPLSQRFRDLFGKGRAEQAPAEPAAEWSHSHLPREDEEFRAIWEQCQPYTMTSFARGLALFRAIRHIVQNRIQGDIVECGVWRGGSIMIAMATLRLLGAMDRRVWLFDTFEGMTEPSAVDVDNRGQAAFVLLETMPKDPGGIICYASLDEVKQNVALVGYPEDLVTYVVGDIRQTIHEIAMNPVALLRLDTDWYDSTKLEMEKLYPHLVPGGVLIVDDYGHWAGSRQAVDEYFGAIQTSGSRAPMLTIVDYTGRMAVKS